MPTYILETRTNLPRGILWTRVANNLYETNCRCLDTADQSDSMATYVRRVLGKNHFILYREEGKTRLAVAAQ